ncbi:DUF1707 and DUF4870 domain-containing protein [Actinocorallia longicatena]|uniref:DUF1707 domain-containing protein n=1 Tax=Actinocorallia longicatena TaxID=111803 RepID=A0ABP6QN42_9ACTN
MELTELRVGHAEREPVIERLNQAYAEGRLDEEELEQRVHLAITSKTYGDLEVLTRDLVAPSALAVAEEATGEDRMLAGLAHASGIATLFVGPLVFFLLSGRRSAYVRRHAAAAVNFQLTLLLVAVVTFGVGALLYVVAWLVALVAGLSAVAQGTFNYPYTIRFLK